MAVHVAFLRAINLGARRQFPKAAIVAATEAAGFTGVATHINTGNVRLETRMRSRVRIEAALEAAYRADRGFEVPSIVLTSTELRAVVDHADALAADRGPADRHYVSLLKSEPAPDLVGTLEATARDGARVSVRGRAVHLLLVADYGISGLDNAAVERRLGVATNRNLTVLRAIVEKWC